MRQQKRKISSRHMDMQIRMVLWQAILMRKLNLTAGTAREMARMNSKETMWRMILGLKMKMWRSMAMPMMRNSTKMRQTKRSMRRLTS